jgi:SOS-response transcriptional repressor LexA
MKTARKKKPSPVADEVGAQFIKIVDDSMSPAFLLGDVVLIHPDRKPRTGDYVAAKLLCGTLTFRRYKAGRGDAFTLVPENKNHALIPVWAKEHCEVLGVATSHYRKMPLPSSRRRPPAPKKGATP